MSVRHEWPVWSTTARVCVVDPHLLDAAVALTRDVVAAVDDAANRFRPDSEISTLADRTDGTGEVRVSAVLGDLVRAARDAASMTDGAVDPTVGESLVALGYDRSFPLIEADPGGSPTYRAAPGWRTVTLDGDRLRIPAGTRLDLGATAKAVTADRAAAIVHAELGCGVLVGLGGDIATAGVGPGGGWQVLVQDGPADGGHLRDRITLADGWAVATSSTSRRTWVRDGRRVHHIVDPATGRPAPATWRTVTVAAPTCLVANAASTATIVHGAAGLGWLHRRGYAARLVDHRGGIVRLGGWPAREVAA